MPTGPSISQSMQVPVREREVLRDYCAPPHSVSSSPSEFVSGRTDCPPTAARISSTPRIVSMLRSTVGLLRCIVHRPARRGAFESTERDGDWPKPAGSDLTPSTTSKPNPEIRILTRMLSPMRFFATFASRAIALPAILILGLGLLGSTTAWAQSTVTYSFCVSGSGQENDFNLQIITAGRVYPLFENYTLTSETCQNAAVTSFLTISIASRNRSAGELVIKNAQTNRVVRNAQTGGEFRIRFDINANNPYSKLFFVISEDEISEGATGSGPEVSPEFSESIPDQEYTVGETIDELTLPEAAGGTTPLTYDLSPDLPDGLRFDASTRRLSGTPTAVSPRTSYTYTVTDNDERTASLSFAITVSATAPEFRESIPDQEYTVGETIEDLTLPEAVGGTAPLDYALSPDLPAGLRFDLSTRRLSGTPTAVSPRTSYTYTVTDNDGRTAPLSFTITVSAAAAAAPEFRESIEDREYTVGEPIDALILPAAVGGTAPLTYALSPALPDGLSFDRSTRRLSGTPTAVFSQDFLYIYCDPTVMIEAPCLSFEITVSAAAAAAPEFRESIEDREYTRGRADRGSYTAGGGRRYGTADIRPQPGSA